MNLMNEEKRYNTLNNYYREKYHKKVFKIPLNGGFSCPNKDGKKGYGGCSYCSATGSGDFLDSSSIPLEIQFQDGVNMMEKKWDGLYIPYFQSNSNTYSTVEDLKDKFERVINLSPKIVGLAISTRPDCLPDNIISYLAELNQKIPLSVELGLQTIHEKTNSLINRCESLKDFETAVSKLRKHNIEVVVHIINGLPLETKEMMVETASYLNNFDIQGIKIHMLHVMKNTKMGNDFLTKPFPLLSLEEYVDITVSQIRHLNPNIIIHRLTGDSPKDMLIEPKWTLKKFVVINEIDKLMRKKKAYQGDYIGQSS